MDRIYYWLDLYGRDEKPANSKVLSTLGFLAGLAMVATWGWKLSLPGAAGLTWPFWACLTTVLTLAFGKDAFKSALKIRSGGGGES